LATAANTQLEAIRIRQANDREFPFTGAARRAPINTRQISLLAASSDGKWPRVLMILRSCEFTLSIPFVAPRTLPICQTVAAFCLSDFLPHKVFLPDDYATMFRRHKRTMRQPTTCHPSCFPPPPILQLGAIRTAQFARRLFNGYVVCVALLIGAW
jgi:hypothetical protein